MTKHILPKNQRDAGLITQEDDHTISIIDTKRDNKVVAICTLHTLIWELQAIGNDYLISRGN